MEVTKPAASRFSIRTSDRRTFRRCMRKWDFQSSLRQNLTRKGTEQNISFWFGSAIHFCMEDYHGYNRFQDPRRALLAYYNAFAPEDRPLGAEAHYGLGISMLTYYMQWMERHNKQTGFETVWMNPETYEPLEPGAPGAVPACEIPFYIPLNVWAVLDVETDRIIDSFYFNLNNFYERMPGFREGRLSRYLPDGPIDTGTIYEWHSTDSSDRIVRFRLVQVYYHGTIDRIVKDRYGRYWLWDYKTAKSADTAKLATDDQVSAYLWAARKLFPFKVYGFVYLQMTKDRIQEPKRLKTGELSCDKRQKTTYGLFRQALLEDYETVAQAPSKLIQMLNFLADSEEPEGDRFIRWDFVKRNDEQLNATECAIYGELSVMLNPNTYCYPSPTRDCSWDCPFRDACIMMDCGDKYGYEECLGAYEKRPHEEDGNVDAWRRGIAWPSIGSDGQPILMPIEDVISVQDDFTLVMDAPESDDDGTFKFHYEEEC